MGHKTTGRTTYKPKLVDKLKKAKPKSPVWSGPEDSSDQGGVTQSMLSSFLCCRERFRIRVIDGLRVRDDFNKSLHYGQAWHVCEENHAAGKNWKEPLKDYMVGLSKKYPMAKEQIEHWYQVCKTQFPIYVKYWEKNNDVKNHTPLLQEQTFKIPYTLPYSGRVVYLRGKMDSVDVIGRSKQAYIRLQENKSKGDVNAELIGRQLTFDLQTMMYMICLKELIKDVDLTQVSHKAGLPVKEVCYNVIRRPLSGGKHSIKQKQGQSPEEFYAELGARIQQDCDEAARSKGKQESFFFIRRKVEVSEQDYKKFKEQCLDPVLEQLCDWYDAVTGKEWESGRGYEPNVDRSKYQNYRLPFGVYNSLTEWGSTELDNFLLDGSTVGLERDTNLFPELQDELV